MRRTTLARWGLAAFVVLAGLFLLVAGRSRQPDFAFLAGHRPIRDAWEVPDNLMGGPTRVDIAYAFPGDFAQVVRAADGQLLHAGWAREQETNISSSGLAASYVLFREPGGMQRVVVIYKDYEKPDMALFSDLLETGTQRKGWVAMTVSRPKLTQDWVKKARHWFFKVFHGDPRRL